MSQCPVCLQPIPYGMCTKIFLYENRQNLFFLFIDERRLIGGKILHNGCIMCSECQKSIGEGAFEQVCLIEIKMNLFYF